MSFVNVAPQLVSTAAADAARIGSAINTANTAAAATTQVLAAAQDEVSTAIAALFGSHGQHYQAISAQVAAYQQRFVLALSQAGSTYAVAEAASATPLQNVLDAINAPVQSLTGRPLIGDGANGSELPLVRRMASTRWSAVVRRDMNNSPRITAFSAAPTGSVWPGC